MDRKKTTTITKNRQDKHLESILNCAFNSPRLCGKFFRREITFSRFNIYFVPFRGLFPVCLRYALTNMIYLDVQVYLYNSFVEVDVLVTCFNFWVFCSFGAFFTVPISALGLPWNKITTREYFSFEMRRREKPYFFTFSGILFRCIQGLFQNLFMYTEIYCVK